MKRSSNETHQICKIQRTTSKEKNLSAPRNSVDVYCRLKPVRNEVKSTKIKVLSSTTLSVNSDAKYVAKETNYTFKHVFSSYTSQEDVFVSVALPLLEDLIKGENGLLFTYGVTGSGKTFTLTGEPDNPGIIPHCINTLFNSLENHQTPKYVVKPDKLNGFEVLTEADALEERFKATRNKAPFSNCKKQVAFANNGTKISNIQYNAHYAVFISYIEIYNNNVFDLLDESSGKLFQSKILREDYGRGMYVNGAVEVEIKSAEEAFELFHVGQARKRMGNTILNTGSSRSHSIFVIRIALLEDNKIQVGQLSLVDLAGSERSKRSQTTGARLKEASSINNSLMSLRSCLEILRENQLNGGNRLVPYRDSRLTLLFKSYFEGLGQVRMIVCINPTFDDYEENVQVLKFAETSKDIKIPPSETKKYILVQPKTPKATKTIHTPATVKTKKPSPMFNNNLPPLLLNLEDPEANVSILEDILLTLQTTKQKRVALTEEIEEKTNAFRNRLLQTFQDPTSDKDSIKTLKSVSNKQKQDTDKLENEIARLEMINNELSVQNEKFQSHIQSLHIAVQEKNLQINRNIIECEKGKEKLALHSDKVCQELDKKFKRKYNELQANIEHKSAKLQRVKDFLNEETPSVIQVSTREDVRYIPQPKPQLRRRKLYKSTYKRSRSVGEIYLEHNVVKPTPLGTVFQPLMKRSKSVTKLEKAKDITNSKQNRYCLVAQEMDMDGEIETKLYKGDIVPTCGGGAQVIFNDVERLKQESPSKY